VGAVNKKKSQAMQLLEEASGGPLTFGGLIRAIREGEEETLETFGHRLDVSKQQLSDIENDRRAVSIERAAAWAKLLGYHPGQFVQLALQGALDDAGLKLRVTIEAA
jgi:transcriptional regulator with XRE-family HTH domain